MFPDSKERYSTDTPNGGSGGTGGGKKGSSSGGSGGRYDMADGLDGEEDDDIGTGRDDDGVGFASGPGLGSPLPLQEHHVQLVDEVQRRWEAERERREQMEKVSYPLHSIGYLLITSFVCIL